MKIINSTLVLIVISIGTLFSQHLNVIPQPQKINTVEGEYQISKKTNLVADEMNQSNAVYLKEIISAEYKLDLAIKTKGKKGIILQIDNSLSDSLGEEGYVLEVNDQAIVISGSTDEGVFYGIQTLRQLISEEKSKLFVKGVRIEDTPQFKWRAYMLDESRYFHGEAFVKQILDQMALLKMNVFHWHLTDDAGWRIEIKKYPKLTEVGAYRKDTEIGTWGSGKTSGEPHGGFYTQEQVKDIVAYATQRNITVVPEFEMPGHSSAAIAAYSWLGTAAKEIEVPVTFGRHYDNYDVTKPEVVQFIKDVLLEMFEMFPSEVIHIGGDEVGYKVWEESEHVQKYMKDHGLNTPADLQIDFTNKISLFIEKNGRRMMGWNEIIGKNIHKGFEEKKHDKDAETALAPNVIVHFWKGDVKLATEAAQKGYGIVNSLHSNTYLDYNYKHINLKKAYSFNPIPKGLEEKYHENIYGLGCQMWSEWTPTNKDVEHQTFPRIAAYAEVGWTQQERKDYQVFRSNLELWMKRWKELGINYSKEFD